MLSFSIPSVRNISGWQKWNQCFWVIIFFFQMTIMPVVHVHFSTKKVSVWICRNEISWNQRASLECQWSNRLWKLIENMNKLKSDTYKVKLIQDKLILRQVDKINISQPKKTILLIVCNKFLNFCRWHTGEIINNKYWIRNTDIVINTEKKFENKKGSRKSPL